MVGGLLFPFEDLAALVDLAETVGVVVGLMVGGSSRPDEIGEAVGPELGDLVGLELGDLVGLEVGDLVEGLFVGEVLGGMVGLLDGDVLGGAEGLVVGLALGGREGLEVGK